MAQRLPRILDFGGRGTWVRTTVLRNYASTRLLLAVVISAFCAPKCQFQLHLIADPFLRLHRVRALAPCGLPPTDAGPLIPTAFHVQFQGRKRSDGGVAAAAAATLAPTDECRIRACQSSGVVAEWSNAQD